MITNIGGRVHTPRGPGTVVTSYFVPAVNGVVSWVILDSDPAGRAVLFHAADCVAEQQWQTMHSILPLQT